MGGANLCHRRQQRSSALRRAKLEAVQQPERPQRPLRTVELAEAELLPLAGGGIVRCRATNVGARVYMCVCVCV